MNENQREAPAMPPTEDSGDLIGSLEPTDEVDMNMDELRDTFFQEADENVATIETALLEIETSTDAELPHRLYRAAHSLKGSGAMLGLDDLASFMHVVESTMDLVRTKKIKRGEELKGALAATVEATKAFLALARKSAPINVSFQPALEKLAAASALSLPG